jgi:hypothetical protein
LSGPIDPATHPRPCRSVASFARRAPSTFMS